MTALCKDKTYPIVILFTVCYAVVVINHLPSILLKNASEVLLALLQL